MAPQYSEIQSRPVAQVKRIAPTDQLELFLKHSSIISRIANGITLQTDLMNGSIPIDDAVGELLNFGSVSVSDVANFEGDNVSDLIGKLRSLPKNIDSSANDLEEAALAWDKLRSESESAKNAMAPPLKHDYFSALYSFDQSFKYSSLENAISNLDFLIGNLEEIATEVNGGEPDLSNLDNIFSKTFYSLPEALNDAVNSLTKLNDLRDTITADKLLEDSEEVFKPIQEAIRFREERKKLTAKSTQGSPSIMEANFRKAFELATAAAGSLPQTVLLKSLTDFRVNSKTFQRKFTYGFFNGKHDIDELFGDMQNNWIETVSRGNITQVMLTQSLSTLSHFKSKLTEIDKAFGSRLDKKSHKTLVEVEKLQEQLSKIKEESIDSASVIGKFEDCAVNAPDLFESSKSKTIIENAKKLEDWLSGFKKTITALDLEKLKTDAESFKNSIGFTDWKDANSSPDQVPQALKNLKENNRLSSFTSKIQKIKAGISVNVISLKEDIKSITNGKNEVNSFKGLSKELKVYECLQQLKDESELLAHAIRTTRNLKKLDASNSKGQNTFNIDDFESIVNIVVQVSEKIRDFKSIPERMIKESTSLANETNRLPRNISEIIGSAVTSLRSAHELKKLATASIPQLKQIDNTIKNELKAVTDPTQKKSIEDSWGDHDQDIATLEDAIKQIEGAEGDMNLTEIKFINQYGEPFLQLKQLKDMNIDTKSKIQALDMLIPTSNSKGELEKSKSTLSTIDSLDLQFSNHHTQFEEASMAFQNFYKFFVDITISLQKKQSNPSSIIHATYLNAKKEEPDYALIGGVAGGGSLFTGGVIATLFFVYFKYWKHRVNKNAIRKWIRKQMFTREGELKYCDAYRVHEAFMIAMEIQSGQADKAASQQYLPESKQRGNKFCNPATALHHLKKDGFEMPIHANLVTTPEGTKFIATQVPMKKSKRKDDTREDFWHMVVHEGVENIVMLCLIKELAKDEVYFGAREGTIMQFGRYKVKTIRECGWEIFEKTVKYRQIEVIDTEYDFYVIYQFFIELFSEGVTGEELSVTFNTYNGQKANFLLAPTVVHCVAGIGRTMTFIGVQIAAEAVKLNQNVTMVEVLTQLRQARWEAVQTIRQSYWLQTAVCYKLNEDYKLGMDVQIVEILETFRQVAVMHRGPPDFIEERRRLRKLKDSGAPKEKYCPPKTDKDFGVYILY
ncbi:unnamed protein product [Caenorhabditis brenneri]